MQTYDIEKLAVAAREVARKCAENGYPNAAAQILPLRKIADDEYEGAIIARIPFAKTDGTENELGIGGEGPHMIASGWRQAAVNFTWSNDVNNF